MYTVRQVADLAGVTPRTLHHYDSIGLLSPSRASNGYRTYDEESLLRLQQILFYRELGLDLDHIRRLMGKKDFSVVKALAAHKVALTRRIERLQRLVETVDKTIAHHQGGTKMSHVELFRELSPEEEKAYSEEAEARWDPKVVQESNRRYHALTAPEKQALRDQMNSLNREWAALIGTDPEASAAQSLVERWRKGIEFFWTPDREGLISLARMYNEDPRFKANYDRVDPRLAGYVLSCVEVYVRD